LNLLFFSTAPDTELDELPFFSLTRDTTCGVRRDQLPIDRQYYVAALNSSLGGGHPGSHGADDGMHMSWIYPDLLIGSHGTLGYIDLAT